MGYNLYHISYKTNAYCQKIKIGALFQDTFRVDKIVSGLLTAFPLAILSLLVIFSNGFFNIWITTCILRSKPVDGPKATFTETVQYRDCHEKKILDVFLNDIYYSGTISLYKEGRYFLTWTSKLCTISSTYVLEQIRKYLPSL